MSTNNMKLILQLFFVTDKIIHTMAKSLQKKVISKTGTNEVDLKNNSTNLLSTYQIGDLVWAKIGKYPLWPSIVCIDPDTNTYIKETGKSFVIY